MAFNWWCETTGVEIFICASPVETHMENAVIFEDGKCDDDDLDGQFVNENNCYKVEIFVNCVENIWKMLSHFSLKRVMASTTTLADNFNCCSPSSASRQRGGGTVF